MLAIISDIHGNLEALQAVLDDIHKLKVDAIYCLGDLVGFGPNPRECVDIAMEWSVVLRGYFDDALLRMNLDQGAHVASINESLLWSHDQVLKPQSGEHSVERRLRFLERSPARFERDGLQFLHASIITPHYESEYPRGLLNKKQMERLIPHIEKCCFQGYTHIPGVWSEDARYRNMKDVGYGLRVADLKSVVYVGSVGQPRDGDWRACYVVYDEGMVRFRRVEYDIRTTMKKIRACPRLDNIFANRLLIGG